jgi:hypothetical protein
MRGFVKVFLGLLLGLVLAEIVFRVRDAGAFSHLNIYVADPELGATLEASAETRIAFGGNPATTVHTNARGMRGRDAPSHADVLVVGDSQVFGLGVEDDETFPAQLAEATGQTVVNAGIPTYGPSEYTQMIERFGPALRPKHVVYVINLANDLFELERKNVERHSVWDGWAVRKETAPASVVWFPGRQWLMSRSHLVYAARRLFHRHDEHVGFASEGAAEDVTAVKAASSAATDDVSPKAALQEREATAQKLRETNGLLVFAFSSRVYREKEYADAAKALVHYTGDARDIVANPYAESGRPVDLTAHELLLAALGMEKNAPALRKLAEEKKDKEVLHLLDQRDELRAKVALQNAASGQTAIDSPLAEALSLANKATTRIGARLWVVALPLDVQVSGEEWAKYGKAPRDISAADALAPWVARTATRVGATGLDATAALRAAEPGAFLAADLHMSKKGHGALAAAIAQKMSEPIVVSALSLPSGRSWPPTPDEWASESEITVKGSSAAHCETKVVREWFRVRCFGSTAFAAAEDPGRDDEETTGGKRLVLDPPPSIVVEAGGAGDAYVALSETATTLTLPLTEPVRVRFSWDKTTRSLSGKAGELAFSEPQPGNRGKERVSPSRLATVGPSLEEACYKKKHSYAACAIDNPTRDVECAPGEIVFGATRRCVRECTNSNTCAQSRCVAWQDKSGCVTP